MKTCKKCNHKWEPRVKKPAQCPRCKSYKWEGDEDKKVITVKAKEVP